MTSKAAAALLAVFAIALGAYWYASPYLALRSMQAAAQARDAKRLNAHVDYPRLRESLKSQVSAQLAHELGGNAGGRDALGQLGTALGATLGKALGDRLVDTLVQPELVMRALTEAQLQPRRKHDTPDDGHTAGPAVTWTSERVDLNTLVVYGHRQADAPDHRLALVFERSGFAEWKLTEIRLPPQ